MTHKKREITTERAAREQKTWKEGDGIMLDGRQGRRGRRKGERGGKGG